MESQPRIGRTRTNDTDAGQSVHMRTRDRAARKLHIHTSHTSNDSNEHKHRHHIFGESHKSGHNVSNVVHTAADRISSPARHAVGVSLATKDSQKNTSNLGDDGFPEAPQKRIRPADVERERQRGAQREEELHAAVDVLSELAHTSTRRLDHTYYSILEKVGLLKSTIGSLQELTSASSKLHENFIEQADEVETEFQDQIDAFADFEEQQNTIEALEGRVQASVEKAKRLSERLEAARKRVEVWEKQENAWQAKTSKRLRLFWTCLGIFGTFLTVVIFYRWIRLDSKSTSGSNVAFNFPENASIPAYILEDFDRSRSSYLTEPSKTATAEVVTSEDPRLRLLDEL